jgi:raffinose/stachyose/melibiose transport system substrate-binding protein
MKFKLLGALAVASTLFGAQAMAEDVTVRMLYIGDTKAYNTILEGVAADFMKQNPGVKIVLQPMENEALKAKLPTMLQSNEPPHIFTSWGGGVMLAHEQAGYLADISGEKDNLSKIVVPSAISAFQVDGKQVGVATDLSLVSIYVNKPLIEKAGVKLEDLKTWDGFKGAIQKLKAAGITPLLTSGGDKWPLQFYLGYLMMREGGGGIVDEVKKNGFKGNASFLAAAKELVELGKLQPFQEGWLSKSWPDSAGQFGDQAGAMYLMGNWIIAQQAQNAKDGKGVTPENLTTVGFPGAVPGGKGDGTETLGGIAGYELNASAPPEAVKFLEFFAGRERQKEVAAQGINIPSAIGSDQDIKDPILQEVAKTIGASSKHQNFLDQDLGPDVGRVFNDVATALAAGEMTPEEGADALQEALDNSK